MAGHCSVGLFGGFRDCRHPGGIVRTQNDQARGARLDMVPLGDAQKLPSRVR